MKIVILLLSILVFANAMSLIKDDSFLAGKANVDFVIEANIGGLDVVVEEIISFEHNKIKTHYTTFNGDVPAFDILMDFNEGKVYQYFNLTGKCDVYDGPKLDIQQYIHNLFLNHTEFAGHRGKHLELYEVKHPEEEGSRTWLYGMNIDHEGKKIFVPTRFQSHHPAQKQDYSGEFIDTFSFPEVSASDFEYPQCESANEMKSDLPLTVDIFGVSPSFLLSTLQ